MGTRARGLYRGGAGLIGQFHIGATTVAGALQMRESTQTNASEIIPCTTTAATDFVGVALEAVTYSTTQADFDGFPSYKMPNEEGTIALTWDPLQVIRLRVSGDATTGSALATAAPAQILTNDTADATGLVITDTAVGTADFSGGLIIGRTGANSGIVRKQTSHNNSTDTNVVVPFPRTIAANDTFIRVPFSKASQDVQLTSNFVEADVRSRLARARPLPRSMWPSISSTMR